MLQLPVFSDLQCHGIVLRDPTRSACFSAGQVADRDEFYYTAGF